MGEGTVVLFAIPVLVNADEWVSRTLRFLTMR